MADPADLVVEPVGSNPLGMLRLTATNERGAALLWALFESDDEPTTGPDGREFILTLDNLAEVERRAELAGVTIDVTRPSNTHRPDRESRSPRVRRRRL